MYIIYQVLQTFYGQAAMGVLDSYIHLEKCSFVKDGRAEIKFGGSNLNFWCKRMACTTSAFALGTMVLELFSEEKLIGCFLKFNYLQLQISHKC